MNWWCFRDFAATCMACGEIVPLLTAREAATLAETTVYALCRRAEAGELHFIAVDGSLLVCFNSLFPSQDRAHT